MSLFTHEEHAGPSYKAGLFANVPVRALYAYMPAVHLEDRMRMCVTIVALVKMVVSYTRELAI
jgi:hypothetical protein